MTAEIGTDPVLGRKIRTEDWAQQGASTLGELRAALAAGDGQRALDLLDIHAWETGSLNLGYLDWIGDWVVQIWQRDPDFLWPCLRAAHEHDAVYGLQEMPLELTKWITGDMAVKVEGEALVCLDEAIKLGSWLEPVEAARREVEDRIRAGEFAAAELALTRFHAIGKPPHDALCDMLWLWMTLLAERWGESEMIALIADSGPRLRTAGLLALPKMPLAVHVRHLASAMRGHRSGPGEIGDIAVTEDDEKYVISFDPCGSGGRMRRRGEIDGIGPRQDAPFHFGSTKEAHPMAWGRKNVPYYCLHCAAYAEMLSTDLIGYPSRVTLFDPDHQKPCAWAFYKDPAKIPEEYFTRIGKRKPPASG